MTINVWGEIMTNLKKIFGSSIVLFFSASMLLAFQNCSQSFQTLSDSISDQASSMTVNSKFSSVAAATSFNGALQTVKEPCDANQGWICMANPIIPSDTTIGAWYSIYFYEKSEYDHWSEWTRYEPVLGYYDSGNIIQQQYPYMKKAGIDYLLLDHTNGWGNDGGRITRNALRVINNLPSDIPVAIAGGYPLWAGGAKESRLANMKIETDLAWDQLAQKSNYLKWLDPDTKTYKPLYVVYNSLEGSFPNDDIQRYWSDSRYTVRHSAGLAESSNPNLQEYTGEGLWGWAIHYPQLISKETMAVQAGHNTTHIPGRTAPPVYKEGGANYMKQWLYAIKQKPKNIIIPSWNDWAEETAIEPARRRVSTAELITDSYGEEVEDWLLQITTAYTNLRKGLMPDTYYRAEDDATVYKVESGRLVAQTAMPHRKPVIILPSGSLDLYKAQVLTVKPSPTSSPVASPSPVTVPAVTPTPTVVPVASPSAAAISAGTFVVNGSAYYSNGAAYCYFPTMSVFSQMTGQSDFAGIRTFSSIPAVMWSEGNCQYQTITPEPVVSSSTPISAGLFVIGSAIYYSNGGAYCYFPNMTVYTQKTGKTDIVGVRKYSSIPSVMKFDGNCQ